MSLNPMAPTLGSILSGFNKTINQLETLVSKNSKKVAKNNEKIADLADKNKVMVDDNAKAEIIANRLKALIADE